MSQRITFEQWVPAPLAEVFGFFSDPANLPRIMPPALGARLVGTNLVPRHRQRSLAQLLAGSARTVGAG